MVDYDNASFYDATESESLTHEEPEDALREVVDDMADPGESLESAVARVAPVTVRAFVRRELTDDELRQYAQAAIERISEDLDENVGHPEDPDVHVLPQAVFDDLVKLVTQRLIQRHYELAVYDCVPAGQRTYTAAEMVALLRGDE